MLKKSGKNIRLLACVLETPFHTCISRAQQRIEHATLSPEEAISVIQRFDRLYQAPHKREGLTKIYHIYPGDKIIDRITRDIHEMSAEGERQSSTSSWSNSRNDGGSWQRSPGISPSPSPSSRRDIVYKSNVVPAGNFTTSTAAAARDGNNTPTTTTPRQHHKKSTYNNHPNTSSSLKPDYKDIDNNSANKKADTRAILLFDLNGTLTSHTTMRRSVGKHQARPGTHLLKQLTGEFQLGVFTSATVRTTEYAVNMLEEKVRFGSSSNSKGNKEEEEDEEGVLLFKNTRLILHRDHTMPAPPSRLKSAEGKPWDTVKPLYLHFSKLHRVLLFDDDDHKVHDGERDNVVLIPGWEKDDPGDRVIEAVVECVKNVLGGLGDDADLRLYRCALEDAIRETVMAQELGEKAKVGM
jgi:hypothetical protein